MLSLAMFSVASAEGNIAANVNANVNVSLENHGDATSSTEVNDNENDSVSGSERMEATTTDENEGLTGDEHKSNVAMLVQSLLSVANREGGIGDEVRVIARSQNDSASTSAEAITKINNRGGFETFLVGTDYTSIGQLRSEIVTTQNNIDALNKLMLQTTNAADKATLAAQIQVLEATQAQLNLFVDAHENSFSLFGWLAKMFAK